MNPRASFKRLGWAVVVVLAVLMALVLTRLIPEEFTEAVWALLGVVVGASATVVVEAKRSEIDRQRRVSDWKLGKLDQLSDSLDELERVVGRVISWRETELERTHAIPVFDVQSQDYHPVAEALRGLRLTSSSALGENLVEAAKKTQSLNHQICFFAPANTPLAMPLSGDDMKKVKSEFEALRIDRRNAVAALIEQRDAAYLEALKNV